ncbi:hypothetical protein GALMADRAFT_812535 [Galerina marginata CBS 339.88]|uniref:Uncharacterized protein n=1 Tax=Galerina marginata (strain CBS 339.88) TaxID=685588 RepID=A0A067SIX2_GALM3|nr:hypothetical protein GALMADRAFT_812535 [Galerina marginata CBS 339.88]
MAPWMAFAHPSSRLHAEKLERMRAQGVAGFVVSASNRRGKGFIDFGGDTRDAVSSYTLQEMCWGIHGAFWHRLSTWMTGCEMLIVG